MRITMPIVLARLTRSCPFSEYFLIFTREKLTYLSFHSRCTKGLGSTQPVKWQDAGKTLSNPALKGCHMPDGPGQVVTQAGVYLQYNEVSIIYSICPFSKNQILVVLSSVYCLRSFSNPVAVSVDGRNAMIEQGSSRFNMAIKKIGLSRKCICIFQFAHWRSLSLSNQYYNKILPSNCGRAKAQKEYYFDTGKGEYLGAL